MSDWKRVAGTPGPGDTAMLVDGRGHDFDGLVTIEGTDLVVRRRDDEDGDAQRIKLDDIRWLLANHEGSS